MRRLVAIRWFFLALVAMTTLAAVSSLWRVLRVDGLTPLETVVLALFAILFAWIGIAFWTTALGAYVLRRGRITPSCIDAAAEPRPSQSHTAIVMPVYNEDAERLFAGFRAIYESVLATGAGEKYDFYVLSDSTRPERQAEEERAWLGLRAAFAPDARLYYRRREKNFRRKSGNITEFCENWGAHYDYMIILDADSLMTGETLNRLVALMDANPRAGLIQVPPQLVGRESLFARMQQFASSVYGPVFAAGLAALQGPDGNYWGHNAIIRVKPFMRHCGLPELPGRGPLSGEILSHDFVEAALLRRAGWEVWLEPELAGSFEEPPPTLGDHLTRDRRWCHGNMQHIRLILAQGFRLPSRMHLAMGAMSYLSAPLWFLMLVVSALATFHFTPVVPVVFVGRYPVLFAPISHTLDLVLLVISAAALLYGPKVFALIALSRSPERLAAHGGMRKVLLSVMLESVFSALAAPVAMLSHSHYVLRVFTGFGASWGSQRRDDCAASLMANLRRFAPHMIVGAVAAALVYRYIPESMGWFAPLLLGLLLAVPLATLTDAPALGRRARRRGLFLIPAETDGLPVLDRTRLLRNEAAARAHIPDAWRPREDSNLRPAV